MPEPKQADKATPEPKKFDPKRPHGTVYGHLSGKYEQDGVLFGADGKPVPPKQILTDEQRMERQRRREEKRRERELEALDEDE